MAKNSKYFEHLFQRKFKIFLHVFLKNTAWILQVCKIPKDFGLYFKNTKTIFFVSFNIQDYELICKIYL